MEVGRLQRIGTLAHLHGVPDPKFRVDKETLVADGRGLAGVV